MHSWKPLAYVAVTSFLAFAASGASAQVGPRAHARHASRSRDRSAPSTPSHLSVSATGADSLTLTWTASTDNVGVAGYRLFLHSTRVGSTAATTFVFTALTCGTSYDLGVRAYDRAGNVSAIATLSASTSACVPVAPQPSGTGFVTRSGQQLLLNGAPYRFVGFNLWRANVASWNKPPNTGYLLNDGTTLDTTLKDIDAGGGRMNVVRAWFLQQFAVANGAYDWAAFDKTLQVAQANGFKVIATLADGWSYEGPPFKDTSWYQGGYATAVASPYEIHPYRRWVQDVVSRYKDNPTILAWELVNEPDVAASEANDTACGTNAGQTLLSFVHDVGGLIKSIDPNHLVSLGAGGNGACGTLDGDYQLVMSDPSMDLCSFHDYYGPTNTTAYEASNGLNVRVQQCAALNKPLYVGEMGIHSDSSPCSGSLSCRASYLQQKLTAAFGMQGMVGYLPWQFDDRGASATGDDYVYGPGDPGLSALSSSAP